MNERRTEEEEGDEAKVVSKAQSVSLIFLSLKKETR